LGIILKIWAPLRKLVTPPVVPRWLQAWLSIDEKNHQLDFIVY